MWCYNVMLQFSSFTIKISLKVRESGPPIAHHFVGKRCSKKKMCIAASYRNSVVNINIVQIRFNFF